MTSIHLSKLNDAGATATIEQGAATVDIVVEWRKRRPKTICRLAAKRLRAMADKFDALAESAEPFKSETQRLINQREG
jgi:hypothetical protein